jgi:hypothetical protein
MLIADKRHYITVLHGEDDPVPPLNLARSARERSERPSSLLFFHWGQSLDAFTLKERKSTPPIFESTLRITSA